MSETPTSRLPNRPNEIPDGSGTGVVKIDRGSGLEPKFPTTPDNFTEWRKLPVAAAALVQAAVAAAFLVRHGTSVPSAQESAERSWLPKSRKSEVHEKLSDVAVTGTVWSASPLNPPLLVLLRVPLRPPALPGELGSCNWPMLTCNRLHKPSVRMSSLARSAIWAAVSWKFTKPVSKPCKQVVTEVVQPAILVVERRDIVKWVPTNGVCRLGARKSPAT